ncbi:MAG: glycosyltransferase family 2 protein [Clostridia bacterium]|nr:glycosyltransferase family 2 protein [Clostridia bacterium]
MPAVSVLMGAYNCGATLAAAVEAVQNQTFTDWELIICDDGSADDTSQVAQALAAKDSRIVFLQNETNLGLPKTLNRCAAAAAGRYFARMDGDDTCDPTRFEKEYAVISQGKYAVVSCGMRFFDDGGVWGSKLYKEQPKKKDMIYASPFCHAGAMFSEAAFNRVGGYSERTDRLRVEDYDLWYRMYKAGFTGYNLQEPLYAMRDDRAAAARRKLKYRVNEYKLKKEIARSFKLGLKGYLLACKPILLGLCPPFLYRLLHRARLSK